MGSGRRRILLPTDQAFLETVRDQARHDPDWFIENFLYIATELDGLQLIKYKYDQRRARDEVIADKRAGIPVRHFRLKSRRVGMSTLTEAETFTEVFSHDYVGGMIIAHDKKRAERLLDMAHLFYENLPDVLKIPLKGQSKDSLKFALIHSWIAIMTAENFEAVRGEGLRYIHISEFSEFTNPWGVLKAVLQPLPRHVDTHLIVECTAKGAGSEAHDFWLSCHEYGFKRVFFPWFEDPRKAVLPLSARDRAALFEVVEESYPDMIERLSYYKLSPEQICWYYETVQNDCLGDEIHAMQEYPCDAEEAWVSGGEPLFPMRLLEKYRAYANGQKGELYDPTPPLSSGVYTNLSALTENKRLDRLDNTYLEVWKEPVPGRRYLIGADCAAGYQTGDFSSAFVVDMLTCEMMAEFHGRVEPHIFAKILACLGYIYNRAIIAPEIDGVGYAVLSTLQQIYHWIYHWRSFDAGGLKISPNKLGWYTSHVTRPILIANAKKIFIEIARHPDDMKRLIKSRALIDELKTFTIADDGKPQAAHGCFDDRCMSWFITLMCIAQETYGMSEAQLGKFQAVTERGQEDKLPARDVDDILREVMGWAGHATNKGLANIWED